MTNLWRCHLIVNRKFPDSRKHVCDFIDVDCYHWRGTSALFLKGTPPTNAKIFPHYYARFGKTLNISTDNNCTCTVCYQSRGSLVFIVKS